MNEITLRNAVNRALVAQFGSQWPYSGGFLRTLPAWERKSFETGRAKLESTFRVSRVSTGDVVAAQTYWFWVMLLTSRFENRLWQREFPTGSITIQYRSRTASSRRSRRGVWRALRRSASLPSCTSISLLTLGAPPA